MKAAFKWGGAIVALLVVAVGAIAWFSPITLILAYAGWMKGKVAPNHAVTWEQGPAQASAGDRPPNVVVIAVDDMGYNDITLHGGGIAGGAVPTPNINAIARGGVEFANGYAGNATCAPSRAAILTGRYATRFGFEFTPVPPVYPKLMAALHRGEENAKLHPLYVDKAAEKALPEMDDEAIPTREITVAGMLKPRGYHTVHIGKWHLGSRKGTRPEDKGFDESLGFMPGAAMYLKENDPGVVNAKVAFDPMERILWRGANWGVQYNGSPMFEPKGYMTDYLTDQAMASIHANRNRPFLLYYAPSSVHTPLQATRADYEALPQIRDHTTRVYAAMIRNLDRNIGRLMAQLRRDGLDDNTLVVFTSDNGGTQYIGLNGLNAPYRGWKATFFEGGLHVPFFMRWPKHIRPGSHYAEPVAHVDIAATAAGVAGASMPRDRVMDGVDLMPFVTGKAQGAPHKTLFWRSGGDTVVIEGGWKLQRSTIPKRLWLYDLKADPTETRNLATAEPARARALEAVMNRISAEQAKPLWPAAVAAPIPIDKPGGVLLKPGDAVVYWNN